jgi:hypothetical protein
MNEPKEPVTVWGDGAQPLLEETFLIQARSFLEDRMDDTEYITDANGEDFELINGDWRRI